MAEYIVLKPGDLAKVAKNVVRNLVPETVRDLSKLNKFVIGAVVSWFVAVFVNPVLQAFIAGAEATILAIQFIFLGADLELGTTGPIGLADVVLAIVQFMVAITRPIAMATLAVIGGFNQNLGALAADAGLAAPAIVAALYVVELFVVAWVSWYIIRALDIPLINLGPALKALSAPYRWVIRRFT